jgi:AcrR family transcriptional regulator
MENNQVKTNRKIRYTRMVLRESLMELMKTKAISDISIKEICAAADISRSTFYAHYKDQYYFMFVEIGSIGLIYHWIKNNMNKSVSELAKLMVNITKQIGR